MDDGRARRVSGPLCLLVLLVFVWALAPGGTRAAGQSRDVASIERRPISRSSGQAGPIAATDDERKLAERLVPGDRSPLLPNQYRPWREGDTMMPVPLDWFFSSPAFLYAHYVCKSDAVTFGVVESQRVLLNSRRTATFTIHGIRVTTPVRHAVPGQILYVATKGGRVVLDDDEWFETGILDEVPLRGVETLFQLYRWTASHYQIGEMHEAVDGRFDVFGLTGTRTDLAERLRAFASVCP